MRWLPTVKRTERLPDRFWPESSLLDDFFGDFAFGPALSQTARNFRPTVDIFEKEGNLVLSVELPGISEKEIDLSLDGNVLNIRGERESENKEDSKTYHRQESFHGTFRRSFALPETVDPEGIAADYKNGVLTVTIPHKPEAKPREIPVSVH